MEFIITHLEWPIFRYELVSWTAPDTLQTNAAGHRMATVVCLNLYLQLVTFWSYIKKSSFNNVDSGMLQTVLVS